MPSERMIRWLWDQLTDDERYRAYSEACNNLRAAVATQPQPLFEAVVKSTMPSSLHMDGTHPVTLAAWADTETLRQVKGQRVVVCGAVAGSATPEKEER